MAVPKQRQKEIEDFLAVLKTPEGRRFIWRLLGMTRLFEYCAPEHESLRRLGVDMTKEILAIAPSFYVQMQNEAISETTRKRMEEDKTKGGTDESENEG